MQTQTLSQEMAVAVAVAANRAATFVPAIGCALDKIAGTTTLHRVKTAVCATKLGQWTRVVVVVVVVASKGSNNKAVMAVAATVVVVEVTAEVEDMVVVEEEVTEEVVVNKVVVGTCGREIGCALGKIVPTTTLRRGMCAGCAQNRGLPMEVRCSGFETYLLGSRILLAAPPHLRAPPP
jgi:hypothetical protein